MTTAQQNDYWQKFHRFQIRYELLYHPKINKALKDQVQQYIKYRDTIYVRSSGLYGVLVDLYKTTGPAWAYQTRSHHKKDGGQMGFSERIVTFMQRYFSSNLLNDAEGITQTTIRLITEVLSEAALEGWSFDEIVDKLVSPDFTATRARLIARTETVNAANMGSMINLKIAGATKKIWISARDNRTREHHREVNQTIVGIDEKFKVGDSLMDHPGDKAGSAAEVCNCRCAVAGIVDDKNWLTETEKKQIKQDEERKFMEPVLESVTEIETMINSNTGLISNFTNEVKSMFNNLPAPVVNVPEPVVNVPQPVVNIPAPVVNVEAPVIQVTENILDQSEVLKSVEDSKSEVTTGIDKIIEGQNKIVALLEQSLKPKPKARWEFQNIIENGRIVRSTAKEI